MTDFDPSNPDPHKRTTWALRHYGWVIIPVVILLYVVEVAADSRGYNGALIVQGGLLIFCVAALMYDKRAKRKRAAVTESAMGAGRPCRQACCPRCYFTSAGEWRGMQESNLRPSVS